MARVEITVPGERIVEEFTALVPQVTTPSTAIPVNVGLVEISQSQPTQLIPGPVGPQGPRGSRWYTGDGPPPPTGPYLLGDMYVDDITGTVWTWDGTQWIDSGTNIQGSPDTPAQVLAKLVTVDGAGSGLDADTLDGHDSTYFATDADMTAAESGIVALDSRVDVLEADTVNWGEIQGKPATFPPTLPIPSSGVTGLDAKQASQDTAINLRLTDAPSDGLVYGRKNALWSTVIGGAHTDDLPPPPPLQDGQLWWKSNTGNLYIWYADANSSQWVQIAGTLESPYPVARATALPRNRAINGAMQVSQENGNTASGATGYSMADQWGSSFTTGAILSQQRVQSVTPNGSVNRVRVTVTTADTSVTAGDIYTIEHAIEGSRVADFRWGTASARQVVVRFGFRGPAGTYSCAIRNGAGNRAYPVNFTITAGQANTDTEQVFVIPGDTSGTWPVDTSKGMSFFIVLQCGTDRQGTANTWNAMNAIGTAANTNGVGTNGNVFELFDVGLYLDPDNTGLPPPWQMPNEAEELAACRRYYAAYIANLIVSGIAVSAGQSMFMPYQFQTQMRATPTVSFSTLTNSNTAGMTVGIAGSDGFRVITSATAAGAFNSTCTTVYANARI